MKDILEWQLHILLEMYIDPDELMFLVSQPDYQGNDCFWFMDKYNLYNILDCRIMDRVISKKWTGKFEVNSAIMDYSTAWTMLKDKNSIFATDLVFFQLDLDMFNFDRGEAMHQLKFNVWLNSMYLRALIDASFAFLITLYFQWQLNNYLHHFTEAKGYAMHLNNLQEQKALKDFTKYRALLKQELEDASVYMKLVIAASFIHILFPLNQFMEWFFLRKTKRSQMDIDINVINELVLFVAAVMLYDQHA